MEKNCKKDLFHGQEYDIIEPKEGDIVRINIHSDDIRSWTRRDYFLTIWPPKSKMYYNGAFRGGRHMTIAGIRSINLGGLLTCGTIGFDENTVKYVKPTMHDLFEFSYRLMEKGLIYSKKQKTIMPLGVTSLMRQGRIKVKDYKLKIEGK
jgi:hypothetical protein